VRWAVVVVLLLVGACTEAGNHPGRAQDVVRRVGRADLSIGQLEGAAEYAFGRVSGITEGATGEIYVSDAQANAIRVFDANGVFLRTIGREGQGPGELESPCCIAFGPENRLWVRDSGNRRYDTYVVGDDPPRTGIAVRMVHFDGGLYAPITVTAGRQLVDVGHHSGADGTLGLWRFTVSDDGAVQARVLVEEPTPEALGTTIEQRPVPGGLSTYYFPQPYGPASLVAHGPGGRWATAVSSRYVVELRGDSSTVAIRGPDGAGPTLSAEERQRAAERLAEYVRRGGGGLSDYPPVPDRKAPLRGMFFDVTGRLWVELSVPADSARRADLYDAEGMLVEERIWPADVSLRFPAWVGDDHALGIVTDSLGVEKVVRVRFER
jgi:hypothetical protein